MIICGIYKIENISNKKVYIGQSKNILLRFSNHKYELKNQIHSNTHLQNSWNKYGEENFIFDIICECDSEEINEKEIYFIGLYNSFEYGYNRTEGGTDSETAKEYGRRVAEIIRERKKTSKNKCVECGKDTKNGYYKYCSEHKNKCLKCGKRFFNPLYITVCDKCRITYNDNRNPSMSNCINCGKEIRKNSNIQKYCKECAKIIKSKQQKALMKKIRARRRLEI